MHTLNFLTFPGIVALVSLFLMIGQLLLSVLLGAVDIDADADGFGDFDMSTLYSPKGIIHFLCGASWYLVLVQPIRENGNWLFYDWFIAIGVGLVVSILLALLYYGLSKLSCEKDIERGSALIGRSGRVYLNNLNGNYDVNITVSGMSTIFPVTSESGNVDLKTGDTVTIKNYSDGIYFID